MNCVTCTTRELVDSRPYTTSRRWISPGWITYRSSTRTPHLGHLRVRRGKRGTPENENRMITIAVSILGCTTWRFSYLASGLDVGVHAGHRRNVRTRESRFGHFVVGRIVDAGLAGYFVQILRLFGRLRFVVVRLRRVVRRSGIFLRRWGC